MPDRPHDPNDRRPSRPGESPPAGPVPDPRLAEDLGPDEPGAGDPLDEAPLDDVVLAAARAWHRPPETPRELMWRAIERDRRIARPGGAAGRRWLPWAGAAAAAALVALGVGIGRISSPATPAAPSPVAAVPAAGRVNETAYRLATAEHLGQSEAFLTLFRASLRNSGDERMASTTARQLLASNRLLLDSPAGQDRRTRLLLEDLELVLAEIAQLSPQASAGDRELVREGMERGGVLTRLRTVVPAGTTPTRGDL